MSLLNSPSVPGDRPQRGTGFLRCEVAGTLVLIAGALGIGLLVNTIRQKPLPLVYLPPSARLEATVARISGHSAAAEPRATSPDRWQSIALDEFQEFVSSHRGKVIDARSENFYGLGHVPGAINLSRADFEKGYASVRPLIEPEKERPIVVYCSEADCKDSELVAGALGHLGYRQISIYKEGWEEWKRAGLPEEKGPSR